MMIVRIAFTSVNMIRFYAGDHSETVFRFDVRKREVDMPNTIRVRMLQTILAMTEPSFPPVYKRRA
jgi:hypothetical protein